MKSLILTPNKNEMCGMYQLAKDLAKEFNGRVLTKNTIYPYWTKDFDEVITFLYPMHKYGKIGKSKGLKWVCYDQGVPPVTKENFPNFFRRLYMQWFSYVNKRSMKGADKYWELSEREQKPRWIEKTKEEIAVFQGYRNWYFNNLKQYTKWDFALYVGRRTDYKNFDWLAKTMYELKIPFVTPPNNCSDEEIHTYYSNAKIFVTASLWEGYGRPVMEAQALNVPVVCYDVGVHKKLVKNGKVIPVGNEEEFKRAIVEIYNKK